MNELKRVLHVEDEPDILEITRLALSAIGELEVDQFSDGYEAIKMVAEHKPDMFLLDQMMPTISGEDTLKKLREVPGFEKTPAVFMTAQSTGALKDLLEQSSAIAVISKPFDPMTLADELREVWEKHTQMQVVD